MNATAPLPLSRTLLSIALSAMFLGCAAISVAAEKETDSTRDHALRASELARVSGLSMGSSLGMIASAHKRGDTSEVACLREAGEAPYVPAISKLLAALLEPGEMDAAIAFYTSTAGHGYVEYGRIAGLRALGADSGEALPTLSPAELEAVKAFAQSPAGRKLISREFGTRLQGDPDLARAAVALIERCRPSGAPR